ncbi:S9 family peptidase [Hufsiella ginkgonis]|uniref:Prolyl oligopeptidase family serine peptidase n=1 Tax=Hufsiella ginkgonis TaxID=2695274 RepID=A0A7K1XUV2_9SPHI|nr:S9 family peptidase [Hufsiella ginkgonis]MXV14764.1 prolyl oligopeptidase family serine peptidase [Hufsiella ginkgonis]
MKKLLLPVLFLTAVETAVGQQPAVLTAKDYERAEKALSFNTSPLVDRASVRPTWLPDGRFWYRVLTATGSEYVLVDPVKGTRGPAFDHQKLAAALSAQAGTTFTAEALPFQNISFAADGRAVTFAAAQKAWNYDLSTNQLTGSATPVRNGGGGRRGGGGFGAASGTPSPDGKRTAFIRDYNLWVRETGTNKETQLTTDGIKDFGYATDNAGWTKSDNPVLAWSPDSKKIATFKQDQRNVSDMYLVTTNVGKPTLQSWKYPLAGDKEVAMIERVIIEVESPKVIRIQVKADPHRGTQCDDISCTGAAFDDVEWNDDATQLAFVSTSRDHKQEKFRIADAVTGAVREVFEESVATQFESGRGTINWHYLANTNEILWYSERDNWGHMYLYDAKTGNVKNQITRGPWVVTRVVRVDEKNRMLYFLAGGREPGQNPYFAHLYKIGFDGKKLTALTPEEGNHQVTLSPSGNFFVDTYSKQDVPPVTVLRNFDGKLVKILEKADISRLTATGWKAPTPFMVKARDGQIELYGLMYTPSNLDPRKKYPVVNYIYPGPQGGSVRNWGFSDASGDNQALAELGFVVVSIEGTCNPLRSKSFHDACYGNMCDNTLPDQVTGMQQLAQKYPYMDLNRVGIWGHSGGGFATAAAMFRYPEFFKVGIAESGNHDNRNYEDDWGERYIGLLTTNADGTNNYEPQANQNYAKNLKGKLMIAHGLLDDNVPPYNSLLVIEALEKANKDYDLVIFPNSRHGYGEYSGYMMRKRWDYFVQHLMGATPPKEYQMKTGTDPRNGS